MHILIAVHQQGNGKKRKVLSCLLSMLFVLTITVSARAEYEKSHILDAKTTLAPEVLKGKYHKVNNQVKNDGLFYNYTVESQFGTFHADSTNNLKILVHEFDAIAAMRQVEADDTALEGLKQSGEKTVAGLKSLFTNPKDTLEGAASGVGSLFNRAKETVGKRKATDAEDSRFEQLVGISKSKGIIATKFGVSVYSRNAVVQEELDRLGRADYLGSLGVGVATSFIPGVGGLIVSTSGTARLLNEAINTTPASELWLQNKNKLLAMKVDVDIVELFLNNPSFNPALETVLVTALETMKGVENRALFIKVALQAANLKMAGTITEIAVMSAGYHEKIAPLASVVPMARLTQGLRKDGTRVVLLPTDYITWNKQVAEAAAAISEDAKGSSFELWVLGSLSKQATSEFQEIGWKIHTEAGAQLLPGQKK